MVKPEGKKFCVYDAEGKKIGSYDTEEEANAADPERKKGKDGLKKAVTRVGVAVKAFSEAARQAALEARRAKSKGKDEGGDKVPAGSRGDATSHPNIYQDNKPKPEYQKPAEIKSAMKTFAEKEGITLNGDFKGEPGFNNRAINATGTHPEYGEVRMIAYATKQGEDANNYIEVYRKSDGKLVAKQGSSKK